MKRIGDIEQFYRLWETLSQKLKYEKGWGMSLSVKTRGLTTHQKRKKKSNTKTTRKKAFAPQQVKLYREKQGLSGGM